MFQYIFKHVLGGNDIPVIEYSEKMWRKYLNENKMIDRKICPICGHVGLFDSTSESKERVICPKCQSNSRSRLYFMYLSNEGVFKKDNKIVGVSPDKAIRSKLLAARDIIDYTVIGKDDLAEMDFESKSVDLLMANYIVDRLENKEEAFSEIKRVLKDDGKAMLSVFLRDEDDTIRTNHYTEGQYVEMLEEEGFNVQIITSAEVCGGRMEACVFGIASNDRITMVGKRA